MVDTRITRFNFWFIFRYEVVFYKIWEYLVINNTFESFSRDWEKRVRSADCLIGTTFAFFHADGKIPCVRQNLKIVLGNSQMDLLHN